MVRFKKPLFHSLLEPHHARQVVNAGNSVTPRCASPPIFVLPRFGRKLLAFLNLKRGRASPVPRTAFGPVFGKYPLDPRVRLTGLTAGHLVTNRCPRPGWLALGTIVYTVSAADTFGLRFCGLQAFGTL